MNSNTKGNIALGQAIAYFTTNGYVISIPLNDCQWYDLIIEKNNIFQTVQVKYTSIKAKSNNYICSLETTSPSTGKILYSVVDKPIDLLFCYCDNADMFLIPVKEIKTKTKITLYTKNPNISNKETLDTSIYYLTKKESFEKEIKDISSISKGTKEVCQYSSQGTFIKKYANCSEAAKEIKPEEKDIKKIYNIATNISRVARGERKTAYGFQWKYI
jgi:hypothetical protein